MASTIHGWQELEQGPPPANKPERMMVYVTLIYHLFDHSDAFQLLGSVLVYGIHYGMCHNHANLDPANSCGSTVHERLRYHDERIYNTTIRRIVYLVPIILV